jgi:hypothetical protein
VADTATFAVVLSGTSIGLVTVTGAARSARFDVNAEPANDADRDALTAFCGGRTRFVAVEPASPVAAALWRSLTDAARAAVADADAELAAELESAADAATRDDTRARIDARATGDAASAARTERRPSGRTLPDSE